MQIIKIKHPDFDLFVDSDKYPDNAARARRKQKLITSYRWNDAAATLSITPPDGEEKNYLKEEKEAPVVFFENTAYEIMLSFGEPVKNARMYSRTKDTYGSLVFRNNMLYGVVNFGNDIGSSQFEVRYEKNGTSRSFLFHFEVFPIKLDFKNDFQSILNDIEEEYPRYVLDFLHKTHLHFKEEPSDSKGPEVIWWNIFGNIQHEFINACKRILNHPNRRLVTKTKFLRADHIRHFSPRQEEAFHLDQTNEQQTYRSETKQLSADTTENRFLKYVLKHVFHHYCRLRKHIQTTYHKKLSDETLEEMNRIGNELQKYSSHPFFNTVGGFERIRQESLVLHQSPEYAVVCKNWMLLKNAYSMLDGMYQMETKNIARLYEVWCFIMLKKMLEKELNILPNQLSTLQADGSFIFEFSKGSTSRIQFTKDDGTVINLYYNPKYSGTQNSTDLPHIVSATVPQQPDIILQITRNDLLNDYTLTYIFDAKYRLRPDENPDTPDLPPDDAINQMHRYRDALFYKENTEGGQSLKKEIIGGYILFPGTGDKETVQSQRYYQAVREVNIGAFPLSPHAENNEVRHLLSDFVCSLVNKSTDKVMEEIIPQKGMGYENPNPDVLVGFTNMQPDEWEIYSESKYVSGIRKPALFGKKELRYFAPYFSRKGVSYYYEIEGYSIKKRNEIYPKGHFLYKEDTSERLVIRLSKRYFIKAPEFFSLGNVNPYRYVNLKALRNPVDKEIIYYK